LENLNNILRDILVENEPTVQMNINFSNDKYIRHFSASYSRKLSNDEINDRKWIISCQPP